MNWRNFTWAVGIFVFCVVLRLRNLNIVGRTADEHALLAKGYNFAELFRKGDFSHRYWYESPDHPPLSHYIYGLAAYFDLVRFDQESKPTYPYVTGDPVFTYDLTYSRLVSVLSTSITVLLVFWLALKYFSLFTAVASSLILAMMPHLLGYSQLVAHENLIILFFTAAAFAYLNYFVKPTKLNIIFSGVFTGLLLEIKQSNILIFLLLFGGCVIWRRLNIRQIGLIGLIAFLTYFVLWPMPWWHLREFLAFNYDFWFKDGGRTPTVLFGRIMGAPFVFYGVAFLITTPLLVLMLTLKGLIMKKNKILWFVTLWFLVPFGLSFFHHRQHMVRYIIQFYAPLSLLAGIGLEALKYRRIILGIIVVYMIVILAKITPYYTNYFNELVGGVNTVYERKLFLLGEWGEGLRNPGLYLEKNAPKQSVVGLALNPGDNLMYKSADLKYEKFEPNQKYDFVVVNYYNVIRMGFDESVLDKDYMIVFREKADGAELARVYKRK